MLAPTGLHRARRDHPDRKKTPDAYCPAAGRPQAWPEWSGEDHAWLMGIATDERGGLLELDGLTRRFGAVTALDNLSFRVPSGQVVGFLGPNGAGKTTT